MEVTTVTLPFQHLLPYFRLAYKMAELSPCLRRKYGSVIADSNKEFHYEFAINERMNDRCCGKGHCIRDRVKATNGQRTEVGGEIHSEVAALIKHGFHKQGNYFVLVGLDNRGKPLYGKNAYPCHACAMAIKYAGFKNIYLEDGPGEIRSYSIARILEERMEEWQPEI